MDIGEKLNELEMYAEIESSEVGEICILLCRLHGYYPYFISETLLKALESEVDEQLTNYQENSRIVERKEMREITIKELEWG